MRPAFRNVTYNLAGQMLPMAVAVVALPVLVRYAGTDRLGFLGLAWALIGYFALLDLGLSRIVTRRVALADAHGELAAESRVVWRLCLHLFGVVAVIALLLAAVIPARWIVGPSAAPGLLDEAQAALPILWATVPATVVTGLLRGTLEGMQRFAKANALRAFFGVWSFAAPLAILPFTNDLFALTLSIAAGRVLALFAHAWWTLDALRGHAINEARSGRQSTGPSSPKLGAMVREGGWLTVSNVVGPMMVTFDRFAIAAIVSLTAASYYFVPQEVALRLLVIPGAIATTIFPMLARIRGSGGDRNRISRDALLAIAAASLPACAILAGLAEPLITVWMGPQFAVASAPVAALLSVGLFANCCAQAPFAWIQAAGRADVTGKLHLLELPIYAMLLVALTWRFGIIGTALAWSLRGLADCALMFRASSLLFDDVILASVLRPIALGVATLALLATTRFLAHEVLHWTIVAVLLAFSLVLSLTLALRLRANLRR